MHILLTASDLAGHSGREAAAALARGWSRENPDAEVDALGVSDGDRGLLDAVETALGGTREVVTAWRGDTERPTAVPVVVLETGGTAYLAARDVLGSLATVTPATASRGSSEGLGVMVASAVERGARRVVIGAGTTATLDLGTGMLRALAGAEPAPFSPQERLAELEDVVRAARTRCAGVELVLAAAAPTPVRGLRGAAAALTAAVGPEVSQELDTGVARLAAAAESLVPRRRDLLGGGATAAGGAGTGGTTPGAGVGGGLGAAVLALGGRVVPGPRFLAVETDLVGRARGCDLVVVCVPDVDPVEVDRGVVGAVAAAGAEHGTAVLALGERVRLERRTAAAAGISASAVLGDGDLRDPAALERSAGRHARAWRW